MNTIKLLGDIPKREGEKPKTPNSVPHLQQTQNSSKGMYDVLAKWLFSLNYIEERPSTISVPGARAAVIKDDCPSINYYIVHQNNEWTHIHPMEMYGGGSQHLSFLRADSEYIIKQGWGEYHPYDSSINPEKKYGVVLVFAPRNESELDTIKKITIASYLLATNQYAESGS